MSYDHPAHESEALIDAIDATAAMFLATAQQLGIVVTGDRRVSEASAALLLGYSKGHLKRIRQEGNGPVCFHVGMNGSRLSYRLSDLAAFIESMREDVRRNLGR